jgi:hypothetical protein
MKYIDERIIFDFNDITSSNYNGVYRYDILLDNETIFVGNVFSDGNTPKIDITDVLRNFYDTNHNFTETPTKSNIIREVTVVLYNKDQTDEESMTDDVCFIYRQKNYNSLVTTPVLEDLDTQNIATMPMLQGWDYSINKGEFLPTYPKVDSCNLTFDFVGCYQNMPMINDFSVNYNNGLVDNPHYVNISGNGVYQYSLPMCMLLRGITETVSEVPNAADYFSWREREWQQKTTTNSLRLVKYDSFSSHVTVCKYKYNYSDGTSNLYTLPNSSSYSSLFSGNTTDVLQLENKKLTSIVVSFYNGTNLLSSLTLVSKIPDNAISAKLYMSLLYNSANTPQTIFYMEFKEMTYEKYTPICDANSINITTFTTINSSQIYSYKIANLDGKSRYFLKWRDRYGMTQIQPFKGTHTYSEDIEKSTITNYQNIKKITDVSVNGKWKLNTDWISERLYPFYESIFVSPWLQLYDSKEDKLYSVIITDTEYTEKTFKNQNRSLFNLQLEVELDSKQTIIY